MSSQLKSSDRASAATGIDPKWAWSAYQSDARRPWNLQRVGHLFRRAGFGATWTQLKQARTDGPEKTIDRLIHPSDDVEAFNREYDDWESASAGGDGVAELRGWWLRRMLATPHPLLERMTLFWHGHFAATNLKVKNPRLMLEHVQMLRRHALGRFEPMLTAVSKDPAVLTSLGATANRKSQPDEHYARALLENFGMGRQGYTDEDVQSAARAFTGLFVLRNQLKFFEREHDSSSKTLFGKTGTFQSEDVIHLLLRQPQSARFLIGKLYRHFISETDAPSDELLQPLVESWSRDYDILKLVETILRSNLFFDPTTWRRRVKSPIEFALGLVIPLERTIPTLPLGGVLATMGQGLYAPPTVQGWPSGTAWINSMTLMQRFKLAHDLLSTNETYGDRLDPLAVARKYGSSTPEQTARFLVDLFLLGDFAVSADDLWKRFDATVSAANDAKNRWRRFVLKVVGQPEYQLA